MEYNEYATQILIKQRHEEMRAAAHRAALARAAGVRRRPWRAALGTALIRLGAWLLREQYALRTP
jgi:hypothetical protein